MAREVLEKKGGTNDEFLTRDQLNYKISFNKKINELQFLNIIKQNAMDCKLNKTEITPSLKINIDSQNNKRGPEGTKCNILDINISDSNCNCHKYRNKTIQCVKNVLNNFAGLAKLLKKCFKTLQSFKKCFKLFGWFREIV